jgi:hypothetical protein
MACNGETFTFTVSRMVFSECVSGVLRTSHVSKFHVLLFRLCYREVSVYGTRIYSSFYFVNIHYIEKCLKVQVVRFQ